MQTLNWDLYRKVRLMCRLHLIGPWGSRKQRDVKGAPYITKTYLTFVQLRCVTLSEKMISANLGFQSLFAVNKGADTGELWRVIMQPDQAISRQGVEQFIIYRGEVDRKPVGHIPIPSVLTCDLCLMERLKRESTHDLHVSHNVFSSPWGIHLLGSFQKRITGCFYRVFFAAS